MSDTTTTDPGTITVDADRLHTALQFAASFVSDDLNRPLLRCVEFRFVDGGFWLAATDSYSMGWTWVGSDENAAVPPLADAAASGRKVAVYPGPALAVVDLAVTPGVEVALEEDETSLWLAVDDISVHLRPPTLKIEYPDWTEHVLGTKQPAKSENAWAVDPERLASVASAFATPWHRGPCGGDDGEFPLDLCIHSSTLDIQPPDHGGLPYRFADEHEKRWALLMPVRKMAAKFVRTNR